MKESLTSSLFFTCVFGLLLLRVSIGFHHPHSKIAHTLRKNGREEHILSVSAYDFIQAQGTWYAMDDCFVLLPSERIPKSIIHFVGGFGAGTSVVTVAYSGMLSALAESGHLVIATPLPERLELDHGKISETISLSFKKCYDNNIKTLLGNMADEVPIIGLSHSLGGKLTALMNSRKQDRKKMPPRAGNIYLAFNNYGMKDNFDLLSTQAKAMSSTPQAQQLLKALDSPEVKQVVNLVKESKFINNLYTSVIGKSNGALNDNSNKDNSNKDNNNTPRNSGGIVAGALDDIMGALGNQLGVDIAKRVDKFSRDIKEKIEAEIPIDVTLPTIREVSVPSLDSFEFNPSPEETWKLIQSGYNLDYIRVNILNVY